VITRRSAAFVVAALAALAGCAKGPIRGQLTLPQQSPQPATITYESSLFGKTGKLTTTLPTGESFTGPYLLDPAAPDKTVTSTLAGDRGNSLVCRFTLTEPGIGPEGGGTVKCDLSTGGAFDARF
jgi:hypothetical protein